MAEISHTVSQAQVDLARFEAINGGDGRLLHYAKGRIRAFWLRQTLTAFGSVTIAMMYSGWHGLTVAAIALLGESVDLLALRWVIRRLVAGQGGPIPRRISLTSGAFQGATIAICVGMAWRMSEQHEARFLAVSFLISAAINAGITRPHFRPATDARLAIFLFTGIVMMARDYGTTGLATKAEYGFFLASFGLLSYISALFIRTMQRSYEQRRSQEQTLLRHQHDLQLAKDALAQVIEESQRLALVAKYANDSIIISAADHRILWVNDAFTRITGFEFAEAVGRMPGEILNASSTSPATLEALARAGDNQTPVRIEILNQTKSGTLIWQDVSSIPIFDEAGQLKLWIAVERDITQAKDRELELARARIAAEEAGQSKSRFLANMSHEIRTPMNGVIGVAELLAETPLSATQESYVHTILESGRALLAIINDILDLAKLQSGKASLEASPFSPKACIESVLRILDPAAHKKGLALVLEDPAPNGFVLGDEGKIRQILVNLIGNAIKFTNAGSVTIRLRLPETPQDLMEIEVADCGIGIAQNRIEAIFESFSQADNGISRQFGGTGLGLTICAMLAEQMGGGIAVRSAIGQGSVFTLRAALPLSQDGPPRAAEPECRKDMRLRPGLTIMVAEDNRTNMMIVRMMLKGAVLSLIEVENGEEAVKRYREHQPDLILMDVNMPLKDGLQATRDIRAFARAAGLPHCPIIALTANAFGEDREACHLAGLDGFLVKPLSRADLFTEISAHCPDRPEGLRAIGL